MPSRGTASPRSSWPDRKREGEGRAGPWLTLHPDSSAVKLDELPGEGQPEPGAFGLLVRGADLTELLEDRLLIPGGNAGPRVRHGDLGNTVMHPSADVNSAPLRGELQRVGEEVQEHLLHLPLVATDDPQTPVDGAAQPDPAPAGPLSDEDQSVLDSIGQVEVRPLQLH